MAFGGRHLGGTGEDSDEHEARAEEREKEEL